MSFGKIYLCFGIDTGTLLHEEVYHFDISIVTGYNKWGVAKLWERDINVTRAMKTML